MFYNNGMSSSIDYLNYVLDLLKDISGISYKKMMGEYLLYKDGMLFGGIYDDRFLIKKTKYTDTLSFKEELPYNGAKPMYLVDVENPSIIRDIIDNLIITL